MRLAQAADGQGGCKQTGGGQEKIPHTPKLHEPWETDYSSAAPSRVTHVAQCVVFGAVMADAAMLDAALEMDAWGRVQDEDGRRV